MFNKIVLGSSNKHLLDTLKPTLTDRGLCYAINSKSMINTYNRNNKRMRSFMDVFGTNDINDAPRHVNGSGYLHRSTFWLNVKNQSSIGFSKGRMTAAINNWNEFFSVRWVINSCTLEMYDTTIFHAFLQIKRNKN